MLEFICILLIFFEIIFTVFCCKKVVLLVKKVDEIHIRMLEGAKRLLEINDEVRKVIKNINKVVKILTSKKLHQARRIFMMTLDIIQVIVLIRSLNLSKGLKSIKFGTLKKLAFFRAIQEIIQKILSSFNNFCAI